MNNFPSKKQYGDFISLCWVKIPIHCWKVMFFSLFQLNSYIQTSKTNILDKSLFSYIVNRYIDLKEYLNTPITLLSYLIIEKQCWRSNSVEKKKQNFTTGTEYPQLHKDDVDAMIIYFPFFIPLLSFLQLLYS